MRVDPCLPGSRPPPTGPHRGSGGGCFLGYGRPRRAAWPRVPGASAYWTSATSPPLEPISSRRVSASFTTASIWAQGKSCTAAAFLGSCPGGRWKRFLSHTSAAGALTGRRGWLPTAHEQLRAFLRVVLTRPAAQLSGGASDALAATVERQSCGPEARSAFDGFPGAPRLSSMSSTCRASRKGSLVRLG
jgi:hypothetical protein